MSDANLRKIFQKHLPEAHWQAIESWSTGQGVPDSEYCFPKGASGWIENKKTSANKLASPLSPQQIAWIERRHRVGGRVFIAVRRQTTKAVSQMHNQCDDEIYLFSGANVRLLAAKGVLWTPFLACHARGPAKWNWDNIKAILVG